MNRPTLDQPLSTDYYKLQMHLQKVIIWGLVVVLFVVLCQQWLSVVIVWNSVLSVGIASIIQRPEEAVFREQETFGQYTLSTTVDKAQAPRAVLFQTESHLLTATAERIYQQTIISK